MCWTYGVAANMCQALNWIDDDSLYWSFALTVSMNGAQWHHLTSGILVIMSSGNSFSHIWLKRLGPMLIYCLLIIGNTFYWQTFCQTFCLFTKPHFKKVIRKCVDALTIARTYNFSLSMLHNLISYIVSGVKWCCISVVFRNKAVGMILISLVLASSMVATSVITYINDYPSEVIDISRITSAWDSYWLHP